MHLCCFDHSSPVVKMAIRIKSTGSQLSLCNHTPAISPLSQFHQAMNDNSSQPTLTFEPIFNIRLTRMPSCPQPRDKLYKLDGVMYRLSERFVYKPRLNARSYVTFYCLTAIRRTKKHRRAWKLYDGVTIPRKEDLILVGNPDKRTSRLVYTLADQAEYRMLDFSEIPFVTLATTRNISSTPTRMDFGKQNNEFQFTFEAVATPPRSQIQNQTRSVFSAPPGTSSSQLQLKTIPHSAIASPVAACIAAATSYFAFSTPSGHTGQKRSRENAFEEEQDTEANRRQCRRFGSTYSTQLYKRMRLLTTSIGCQ